MDDDKILLLGVGVAALWFFGTRTGSTIVKTAAQDIGHGAASIVGAPFEAAYQFGYDLGYATGEKLYKAGEALGGFAQWLGGTITSPFRAAYKFGYDVGYKMGEILYPALHAVGIA